MIQARFLALSIFLLSWIYCIYCTYVCLVFACNFISCCELALVETRLQKDKVFWHFKNCSLFIYIVLIYPAKIKIDTDDIKKCYWRYFPSWNINVLRTICYNYKFYVVFIGIIILIKNGQFAYEKQSGQLVIIYDSHMTWIIIICMLVPVWFLFLFRIFELSPSFFVKIKVHFRWKKYSYLNVKKIILLLFSNF